jgi:hypothetical protein
MDSLEAPNRANGQDFKAPAAVTEVLESPTVINGNRNVAAQSGDCDCYLWLRNACSSMNLKSCED